MGTWRLASKDTDTVNIGDGNFLELKRELSKRDFRRLIDNLPKGYDSDSGLEFTPGSADDFVQVLFTMLVEGWSLDVPATLENYLDLTQDAAREIDAALVEHFNAMTPSEEEKDKSEEDSE